MDIKKTVVILLAVSLCFCANSFAQQIGEHSIDTGFEEMDMSKDGFLTLEEMQEHQRKKIDELDKNQNDSIDAGELKNNKTKMLEKFDTDKDEKISRQEAFARLNEDFNQMDTDKDGKVSKEEFHEYWPMTINF
jgi:Ca2+-binding EF-hand superfamily protein